MRASVGGVVVGIALTLLIGGACAAASNALALTTKSEDVMAPVINMVMMPVLLLSGILLPMTLGPAWLQRASDFMPFRWIVDAVRGGFAGDRRRQHDALGRRLGRWACSRSPSGGARRCSARRTPERSDRPATGSSGSRVPFWQAGREIGAVEGPAEGGRGCPCTR